MIEHIKELYSQIRPFDAEELYNSTAYATLREAREKIYEMVDASDRPAIRSAIDAMLKTVDAEIEMIFLLFFSEGYTMGREDAGKPLRP